MSEEHHASTVPEYALELIRDGQILGLGTGRAATAFIHALGERVRQGLNVRGVPTSRATASLATQLGIPLTSLEEVEELDMTVDGADEVDSNLDLIKGLGGALVREKIVAAAARKLIICVGPEKEVAHLGEHGKLPVEVIPFALAFCRRRLQGLGIPPTPRKESGGDRLFVTDNGNNILDCQVSGSIKPSELEQAILAIPGVVDTGLFLGMAHTVLIQDGDHVRALHRKGT